MNYIILDLEWNQPFSYKHMIRSPLPLYGEIIQIGAVKLDENYHILDTFKILVSPKFYRKIHKDVLKITNITSDDLQYGFGFEIAFKHFKKWCGEDFTFLIWGDSDIDVLKSNLKLYNLDEEWIPPTYNLQIVFDKQISKENRQISLSDAMEMVNESSYDLHDALNDSKNAARICLHLDMENGLAEADDIKNKVKSHFNNELDYYKSKKTYETRQSALEDLSLLNFISIPLSDNIKCYDFVRQKTDKYICIGKGKNNKEYFIRFKFSKANDCGFYVTRIVYDITEENKAYYCTKKIGGRYEKRGTVKIS